METILITGSPGSGKTSVSNALSECYRLKHIHHIVIDPDEIARIYPEASLSQLKLDGLASLYPLYEKLSIEKIIIPMTIDNDSDLEHIKIVFGKKKLCKLVKAYVANENARSYSCIDVDAN